MKCLVKEVEGEGLHIFLVKMLYYFVVFIFTQGNLLE